MLDPVGDLANRLPLSKIGSAVCYRFSLQRSSSANARTWSLTYVRTIHVWDPSWLWSRQENIERARQLSYRDRTEQVPSSDPRTYWSCYCTWYIPLLSCTKTCSIRPCLYRLVYICESPINDVTATLLTTLCMDDIWDMFCSNEWYPYLRLIRHVPVDIYIYIYKYFVRIWRATFPLHKAMMFMTFQQKQQTTSASLC